MKTAYNAVSCPILCFSLMIIEDALMLMDPNVEIRRVSMIFRMGVM